MTDSARTKAPKTAMQQLWTRYRKSKDATARDEIVRHTIGLVRKIAGRMAMQFAPQVELQDLEAAGAQGLLAAIERYDPTQEVKFETFAAQRIRGAIVDDLRTLDPLTRPMRRKARKVDQAIHALEQRLMRAPTEAEVAEHMGLPLDVYQNLVHGLSWGVEASILPSSNLGNPWQTTATHQCRDVFAKEIDRLPDPEGQIIDLHYFRQLPLREIASLLNMCESRVSQMHNLALGRMRRSFRRQHITSADLYVEPERPTLPMLA